jgi:TonB family protein
MLNWNETVLFSIFMGVALKTTAVLALAWIAARLLRGRSAAVRHLVWTAAAAAVLALPLLSVSLPSLRLPGAALLAYSSNAVFRTVVVPKDASAPAAQLTPHGPAAGTSGLAVSRRDWRIWLMLMWLAGAVAAFGQMLAAFAAVWRIRRSAKPFFDRNLSLELSNSLGIRHAVDVLESEAGSMPMTVGIHRATVLLPSDAVGWSEERRRVVLLHELAHVRRGDVPTHLLARLALALYWWNPLAWIAWREFLKERERAADDLVLRAGARASEYATHLLEVARTMSTAPAIGWAAVAMARPSQLEGRLVAILDETVNRNQPGRAAALAAALLAVGLVAPIAAVRAQDTPTAQAQTLPPDVDAFIRAAASQKNHEMLDDAAQAAERLEKYDTAQKLLESAAEIRAQVSGSDSVAYGIGLLKLADLERMRKNAKSAFEFYTKAAQVLGDRPEAARALTQLGIAVLLEKPPAFARAFEYFQHAQAVDPKHAAMALMWMAVVRQREGSPDEAEKLYQNALAIQDPESPETLVIRKVYGQFLRTRGRVDEAKEFDAATAAMQKTQTKPMPSLAAGVYKIGGGISAPKLVSKVEPQYTDEARAALLSGTVRLFVEIGTDGLAHNLQILQGLGLGLDEKAMEAINQWKFKSATKDGQPVPVMATIEVNFRLL